MSENDILLENVSGEVIDYIRQLDFKKSKMGGYDKNHVLLNIQEICNIYEKHIAKIYSENKSHVEMLNGEIFELRQKNEALSKRVGDKSIVEQANRAISEANSRIAAANERILKLQAACTEAENKLKAQENAPARPQETVSEARDAASEIIRRAHDEADEILRNAREEAERLRDRKSAETSSEERMYEEHLDELKDRYAKCRKYFSYMLGEIKDIENSVDAMVKRQSEEHVESMFNRVCRINRQADREDKTERR